MRGWREAMDRWTSIWRKWCLAMGRSTPTCSAWSWRKALIAPTVIEEGEMITPDTPCSSVRHFNCTGWRRWPPCKRWETASYAGQFGSRLCWKAQKDGSRLPLLSRSGRGDLLPPPSSIQCRTSPSPLFFLSATQQRKQKTIQDGLLQRHPVTNPPPRPEILKS